MTLVADIVVDVEEFRLEAALHAPRGEVTAVVGPNGAGKTTLLRCLCGLEPVSKGRISFGDVVFDEPETGIFVPPAARAAGVAFAERRLFPMLDVVANVEFGIRRRRSTGRRELALHALERVGLAARAHSMPAELSGGESQRIALARALAREPDILLLDEPFSALDVAARAQIARTLESVLDSFSGVTVMVTHSPQDAARFATQMIVLQDGGMTQAGSVEKIRQAPATPWIARFAGMNVLLGTAHGSIVDLEGGATLVIALPQHGPVAATIAPMAVAIHAERPQGSPRNAWPLRVDSVTHHASGHRVHMSGEIDLVADVTPAAVHDLDLRPGRSVWASVKATEVECAPR